MNAGQMTIITKRLKQLESLKKENAELKAAIKGIDRYDISSGISQGDHPCSILEIDKDENGEWIKYIDVQNLIK